MSTADDARIERAEQKPPIATRPVDNREKRVMTQPENRGK